VSFAPNALARIHRCTGGIPRLINLVCDRALLAAYSARTNRVLPAHVRHAAAALDLDTPRVGVLSWARQRLAAFAAGVAVTAVLGAGAASGWPSRTQISPNHQTARAQSVVQASSPAPTVKQPVPVPTTGKQVPSETPKSTPVVSKAPATYSVLVASFRMAAEADSLAKQLRDLGYGASISRTEAPARGLWHQVLAGPFGDLGSARQGEARLRQMPGYADAHLVQH
jgi:general secretion pathway protein A